MASGHPKRACWPLCWRLRWIWHDGRRSWPPRWRCSRSISSRFAQGPNNARLTLFAYARPMNDVPMTERDAETLERALRDELVRGDAMIGAARPILRHLLANEDPALFSERWSLGPRHDVRSRGAAALRWADAAQIEDRAEFWRNGRMNLRKCYATITNCSAILMRWRWKPSCPSGCWPRVDRYRALADGAGSRRRGRSSPGRAGHGRARGPGALSRSSSGAWSFHSLSCPGSCSTRRCC